MTNKKLYRLRGGWGERTKRESEREKKERERAKTERQKHEETSLFLCN